MRVTDLEAFALEQIWRPYWPIHQHIPPGTYLPHLSKLPFTLDETVQHLALNGRWRGLVINRLKLIGIDFPVWVQHPLVDLIKRLIAEDEASAAHSGPAIPQ